MTRSKVSSSWMLRVRSPVVKGTGFDGDDEDDSMWIVSLYSNLESRYAVLQRIDK